MKFLIILALALASASAFVLRSEEIIPRNRFMPVVENEGRIVGGQNAAMANFGYQALVISQDVLYMYSCGGSLISFNWVLTAAHCVDKMLKTTVYLGDATFRKGMAEVAIKVIIHEGWDTKTIQNDIAVINIKTVKESRYIWVVKLVESSTDYDKYNGLNAIASGWGLMRDGGSTATVLKQVTMTVISNLECQLTYGNDSITGGKVCVKTLYGTKHRSTCEGDSGGPLVLEARNPKDRRQIGVTSFGAAAGCEKGYPDAFTLVSSFRDWITQKTGI